MSSEPLVYAPGWHASAPPRGRWGRRPWPASTRSTAPATARYGARVAGVRGGGNVKCLHAFAALQLAGAIPNPVAEWTLRRLQGPYPA